MNFDLPYFLNKHVVCVGKSHEINSFKKFITTYGNTQSLQVLSKEDDPEYLRSLQDFDPQTTAIIKSSDVPGRSMPVAYTTPTRVFFDCLKQLRAKSVGVTGTKGKTTTAHLLAAILKTPGYDVRLCDSGNTDPFQLLEAATENTIFVVELSSYQLAELEQSPDVAIITNLFRDHGDYHGSVNAYWEAQRNIMRHMDEHGTVIYNPETEAILDWFTDSNAQQRPINPQETVDMSQAKLFGEHNKLNYLMVRTAAELFGIDRITCQNNLKSFEPVRHRLQAIGTAHGITFVDDAIGSTPEATVAGIQALVKNKGPIGCVMLGGVDRQYDFSELIKLLQLLMIPKLVLFPDTGAIIKSQLPDTYTPDIFESSDMQEAVSWAAENTPSGSICLLSTAAPSTVLWASFEEKGDAFQKAVHALT